MVPEIPVVTGFRNPFSESHAMSTAQSTRLPRYRKHKPTGQAVVTLDGHDFYLGPWNCAASRREYDRLTGEWLAAGRRLPRSTSGEVSIVELAAAYWKYASGYYRKGGKATRTQERVKLSLRHLRRLYGEIPADQFGPLALQAMQQRFVREGKSRPYVNCLIEQIRRVFKWGVSQELVPASVFQALATVPGLRKGRTEAPEPEPVRPVEPEIVESTLPLLPPVVRDMVQLQRLTGARPGEICILRPSDIDRTGDVWRYRPESHKTEHHGRERIIHIGPRAQAVLRPYLLRDPEAYCFVPVESARRQREAKHAARKTPLSCGNRPGTNRVMRPRRPPGMRYSSGTYGRAVARACDAADRAAHTADPSIPTEQRIVPRWAPNRLRHSLATEIRGQFGLEATQVVLGHAHADVTEVYAERDARLAAAVMKEVG
jgi:integrase